MRAGHFEQERAVTPVYVTNFNNLDRGFRNLVDWLLQGGMPPIVLDNASTWEPLLRYYESSGLTVIFCGSNLGPYAFWERGLHREQSERFIVTDPDVVPSADCPLDLIERMSIMLDKNWKKVGPSLRIDNLPGCYPRTEKVLAWENQFWAHPVADGFEADIDTTFAMYEPGSPREAASCLRLAPPYSFEHLPWYEGPEPNPEREFYNERKQRAWTNW